MENKRVAIIGSGVVGEVLANAFLKCSYEVLRASREPQKLDSWQKAAGPKAKTGNLVEAATFADLMVLAVKGEAAEASLEQCQVKNLRGKIIIDANNPISPEPPEKGVLRFFTGPNDSLMERLQKKAPEAYFVKAFSCVGSAFMYQPKFHDGKPTMFICGNHLESKQKVQEILALFGWESEDMGPVEAARAIEPLCILWCLPGFLKNEWSHAFKLLKK